MSGSPQAGAPPGDRPRVLVIRGGAIGDFILTLPAVRLLREGLPVRPHLEILGYPGIASLAVMAGLADAALSIEHGSLAPFFVPGATLDPTLAAYLGGFQLVVSYLHDPDGHFSDNLRRSGVKTLLCGPHRVEEEPPVPAAAQLARPLRDLALYLDEPWVSFALPEPVPNAAPGIVLHPGSGSARKNWGYERWVSVAAALRDMEPDGPALLIVSGEAESGTIKDFFGLLRERGIPFSSLAGAPLPDVARAIAGCRLFLGHDSGISHLAAATGVPCLLLFGPTDPSVWAPRNPRVSVIRAPGGNLAAISPGEVVTRAGMRCAEG